MATLPMRVVSGRDEVLFHTDGANLFPFDFDFDCERRTDAYSVYDRAADETAIGSTAVILEEIVDGVGARVADHRMIGAKTVLRLKDARVGDVLEFAGAEGLDHRDAPILPVRQMHDQRRNRISRKRAAE